MRIIFLNIHCLNIQTAASLTLQCNMSCRFRPGQATSHLLQVFVTVDKLSLVRVLEFMGFDVLPQSLDDDRSGLGVDAQHAGQSRVQLELRGLGFAEHRDTALARGRSLSTVAPAGLGGCLLRPTW